MRRQHSHGKGDARRPEDNKRYRDNYDAIFGKKDFRKRCESCGERFEWVEDGSFKPICNECKIKEVKDIITEVKEGFDEVKEDLIDRISRGLTPIDDEEEEDDE